MLILAGKYPFDIINYGGEQLMSKRLIFIVVIMVLVVGTAIYAQPSPDLEQEAYGIEQWHLENNENASTDSDWRGYNCHNSPMRHHAKHTRNRMMEHHFMGK